MAPGHQQIVDLFGQQHTIRHVVVASPRNAVVETRALREVFFRHHVFAFQQTRLAHPRLRGDVDHIALLKARKLLAYEIDDRVDVFAAL